MAWDLSYINNKKRGPDRFLVSAMYFISDRSTADYINKTSQTHRVFYIYFVYSISTFHIVCQKPIEVVDNYSVKTSTMYMAFCSVVVQKRIWVSMKLIVINKANQENRYVGKKEENKIVPILGAEIGYFNIYMYTFK